MPSTYGIGLPSAPACQYVSFLVTTSLSPEAKLTNLNGPVPTGLSFSHSSPLVSAAFLDTIGVLPFASLSEVRTDALGRFRLTCTVDASTATAGFASSIAAR